MKCGIDSVAKDHKVPIERNTEKKASLGFFRFDLRKGRSFLMFEV